MADGWGGVRPGAGRPKLKKTELQEKALAEAQGDAEYALGLIIQWMRDDTLDRPWRRDCAVEVMDRVWGKATQRQELSGEVDVTTQVMVYIPDNDRDQTPGRSAGNVPGE